jgi:ABC-type amino acid transport substrate-binding protein
MIEEIKNSDFTDVLNSKLAVVDFSIPYYSTGQTFLFPKEDRIN